MDKTWTAQDFRDIAHKSAGPYSAAVHICSVEMLQHAADLLDRITALESDAEVDAQLIRDKDAVIEKLEAQVYQFRDGHNAFYKIIQHLGHPAVDWTAYESIGAACADYVIEKLTASQSQAGEIERLKAQVKETHTAHVANIGHVIMGLTEHATRQPLREWPCRECADTCNHAPRGGEGESGGHKERP